MRRSRPALIPLLCLLTAACKAQDDNPAPDPPDLTVQRAAFVGPSGTLSPETAPLVVTGVLEKLALVADLEALLTLLPQLTAALGDPAEKEETGALTVARQPLSGDFSGWGRLTWICTGWTDADAAPDEKWGRIRLNGLFSKGGLGETIWGTAEDCHLAPASGDHRRYTADVAVNVPHLDFSSTLFHLTGRLTTEGGATRDFDVDFLLEGSELSLAIPTPQGGFVVSVATDAGSVEDGTPLSVRDAGGVWACLLQVDGTGGHCERGDLEVEW